MFSDMNDLGSLFQPNPLFISWYTDAYFYYGDCLCLWYVDRGSIIRVIWELPKANLINNGIHFYDGDKLNHFRITSPKWIFHICSLLCNNGAFGSVLQRCANSSFSGEN